MHHLRQLCLIIMLMGLALAEDVLEHKELKNAMQRATQLEGCGGTINDVPEGIIDYPGNGRNYKNNQKCSWEITLDEGSQMEVTFLRFATANNKDKLLVINGKTHNVVGTFFGRHSLPAPFTTDRNQLHLLFTSDARQTQKGFKLTWKKINETVNECEGKNGDNSLLWQKLDSAETALKTTINEGNDNVTDAIEIKNVVLENALQTLINANVKTELELSAIKDNQEMAMENLTSKFDSIITYLDNLTAILQLTEGPTTTVVTTKIPTTTLLTTTIPTTELPTPICTDPFFTLNGQCITLITLNGDWDTHRDECLKLGGSLLEIPEDKYPVIKDYLQQNLDACPDGFVNIANRCYLFSQNLGENKRTQAEARQFCQAQSGDFDHVDLATMGRGGASEADPVLKYIRDKSLAAGGLWLGAQRSGSTIKWYDGRDLSVDSYLWRFGEPNGEGCVVIYPGWPNNNNNRHYLDDYPCNHSFNFVCEKFNFVCEK